MHIYAIQRCAELDWVGMTVRDGIIRYDSSTGRLYGTDKELYATGKKTSSDDVLFSSSILPAVTVYLNIMRLFFDVEYVRPAMIFTST